MARKEMSVAKIRELDNVARKWGLSEDMLIENASSNMCSIIEKLGLGRKALVVSGRGNNGADVLACARKLANKKYNVRVAVLESKPLGLQAQLQKSVLENMGINIFSLNDDTVDQLNVFLNKSDFVLEGLLGVGARGELSTLIKKIVFELNRSKKPIVACDVPSGLYPDTGLSLGEVVKASYTVTFLALKRGFYLNEGPSACGKIILTDIGISSDFLEKIYNKK
ncbi:MAG: NAD(P)H-hydrate epimerase [Candidatus Omnitrophica bacterium]|nr:NAD(P)H-hydrate epimerase [Candidatus Omnitrophota bacterium]MBD3269174.1 NAD(P)H-hydrate epimerase [Candidatus Omnitrophota bacterium]